MEHREIQLATDSWQRAENRYPLYRIIAACCELSADSWILTTVSLHCWSENIGPVT